MAEIQLPLVTGPDDTQFVAMQPQSVRFQSKPLRYGNYLSNGDLDCPGRASPYLLDDAVLHLPPLVVAPLLTEWGTGRHCQAESSYKVRKPEPISGHHRDGFFVARI